MARKAKTDAELFCADDVNYEVLTSKKRTQVDVRLTSESDMNLFKILFALETIVEKIKTELNVMADAEGEH